VITSFTFHAFEEVTSTQDVARDLAVEGKLVHGSVVTATNQSNGRGRYTRAWASPVGGLYMTIALKPQKPVDSWSQLSYVVGVALSEAITQIDPMCSPKLKWVNDAILFDKKVAGILLELLENNTILIGIGINIKANQAITEYLGTYLKKHSNKFTKEKLLDIFLKRFSYNYNLWCDKGFEPIKNLWLRMSYGIGREIEVKLRNKTLVGTFIGIDEVGQLQLLDGGVIHLISAGDIFFHE
jgi:BirA family biotin operon repressor/biotin-[acetyl-CoA-carboxylase] ligase